MISFILKLIGAVVIILVVGAFLRTWQVENSENQKIFAANGAPNPALEGFYPGTVNLPIKVTWVGKNFNAASSTGANVFEGSREDYPFTALVGVNGQSTVLNISYDLPQNPFWIKPIVDQIVETSPGHYLGKITLHLIPNYPFSLGFFRLQR